MIPKKEKRHLERVLKMMNADQRHPITSPLAIVIGWIMMLVAMIILFKLFGDGKNDLVLSFSFMMIGVAAGIFFMMRESFRQWPVFKPHLNKDSIERRLAELEELPGIFK